MKASYKVDDMSITLPGLRMFNGSSACLMLFIARMPDAPNSSINNFLFPSPTPCSPVIVPLTCNDRLFGEQDDINQEHHVILR